MPINQMLVNRNAVGAQELLRTVNRTRDALTSLNALKDMMDEMQDGVNYVAIADYFGVSPTQAQAFYTLFVAARNAVQSAATMNLINRVM